MKYFLILLAIGLVIAPVMAMKPGPRQRQITAFRKRALQLGLRVSLVEKKKTGAGQVNDAVRYSLSLPKEQTLESVLSGFTVAEKYTDDSASSEWRLRPRLGQGKTSQVIEILESMPKDVVRLEIGSRVVAAQWRERGYEQDVDRLDDGLRAIVSCLLTGVGSIPSAGSGMHQNNNNA